MEKVRYSIITIVIIMFSSKVGLTKGSEYPAHPDIPTIGFISFGVFTFVLTAGFHDGDGDEDDVDDDDEEEEEGGYDDHPPSPLPLPLPPSLILHQHHNMTLSVAAFNGLAGSGAGVLPRRGNLH